MKTTAEALHTVNDFFDAYAAALESYNTKKMVLHYTIPCTFLDDQSSALFTDASKLEGLFNQGTSFYKQYGITYARPEVWSKRPWTDKILKAKVNWQYYSADNKLLYACDYYYILKLDKNNEWKIQAAVSVNEKEKMEAWLETRNKKQTETTK